MILSMSGAREIRHEDAPQLWNVVEELSIAGGLPMPKVYLIEDSAMNAFATGRDPEHASVAITRGLMEKLNREERRKRRLPAEAGWGSSKMVGGTSSLISMAPFSGMPSPQGDWHLTPGFHPGYTTL